ncbi:hypothetical protein [Gordonia hydrophobica]|uniref:Uncharacterized protein n=1 Tax=Gordonia hydrophobica TaxID=40516 RepID=A0ABZ2U9C6_9ACTN|nr:hypothetical protein [Gordonia hydrophobica]MBM7368768.1 hypothetical protein [Gordonia hydrophobica]
MNSTAQHPGTDHPRPEAGFRDASFHDLFMDCCRFGPAPTRSRELFVLAVTALLLALIFAIAQPAMGFVIAASVIVAAYMGVRWIIGIRTRWAA